MEGLGVATSILTVVELSAKVASLCLQYSKEVKHAKDDILRLRGQITDLGNASRAFQELIESSNSAKLKASQQLRVAIYSSQLQLQSLLENLRPRTAPQAMSRLGLRSLKWPFQSKDIEKIVQDLSQYTQTIFLALQLDQTTILLNIDQKKVLDRLPVVVGASFDSLAEEQNATCLSNTRVELRDQIIKWAKNSDSESIFWLNGMAGTGKSTISRTIAQSFASTGHLGASFFFKRGEGDRGSPAKLFTTIAAQLATKIPAIAPYIKNAIDADPTISDKGLKEQFDKLILQPLSTVSSNAGKAEPIVIVIDALDECDPEDKVKLIIHHLSRAKSSVLKIFVTSRPELPIRLGFSAIKGKYQDQILHEISKQVIEHDISRFLKHELATIRESYNSSVPGDRQLDADWPGQSSIDVLVTMAIPLFIFAATVCRFIAKRKGGTDPKARLHIILEYKTKSQESKLDATYLPVLNQLLVGLSGQESNEVLHRFQHIVGSIILLASPLSTSALAQLLDIPKDAVDATLDELHSVLSIPQLAEAPVRLLHLSFRDFLVDPGKQGQNPFWIDEPQRHARIADKCLRIMNKFLRQDMCGLRPLGLEGSTVNSQKVDANISAAVKYACRNWVFHLQGAGNQFSDCGTVFQFLKQHFLHWVEALSLMQQAPESIKLIKSLQVFLQEDSNNRLSEFLKDCLRILQPNLSIISTAPLQIYSSVLVFAPHTSIIRNEFESTIPNWIYLKPTTRKKWDQCVQTLAGHSNSVQSVVFSHDSSLVASASSDKTVRLWNTDSGKCVQTLEGHSGSIYSVAFSHDSSLVASASDDNTVRLWGVDTGECVQTLEGHSDFVWSVVFSHDSSLIASASSDKTVRLWNTDSGKCVHILEGHSGWVQYVAFSHDSSLIASASDNSTVRLWCVNSGECIQTLEGHSSWVYSVTFSHNLSIVALALDDETVRLWGATTGECMQTLEGHSDSVQSVAFSHDSSLIASASDDKTVRLWNTDSGRCVQTLKGHSDSVQSVVFSHNSSLIASASDDETVRIWRADSGECAQTPEGHSDSVYSVAFSHDSSLVASASYDNTVRLWRANTGECMQTLEGHSNSVQSVVFSHDSSLIASASSDKTIRLWRANTGECVQILEGHSDWVQYVAFSHDSSLIASASDDKTVRLWRANNGECMQTLNGHSNSVYSMAFSYNSSLIVSASSDNTVRLWRTDSGKCMQTLKGHGGSVQSVAFSHDSSLIASASSDKTVRLWRANTGKCVQILEGHGDSVQSVVFSHDSSLVASAASDKTVRLWRANTGECVQTLDTGNISHLSFNPTHLQLITDIGAFTATGTNYIFRTTGYGLSRDRCWITWNGNNLLWLPVEYRPFYSAVNDSTVALGCHTGRVLVMAFSNYNG